MEKIFVSILTIGTEVLEGEIVNANAATLATLLVDYGYTIQRHLTVADERDHILQAITECAKDSDVLIITGGLGPTKDDFTRDMIAKWCDLPAAFDDPSWLKIVERLKSLGVKVAESNRQQCFFPMGAQILSNPVGTAQGFRIEHRPLDGNAIDIIALPGPPHEIQAILKSGLASILESKKPKQRPNTLHVWRCMGVSESQLGEIVEEALEGTGFITGYRPHIPYVDVKVWTPPSVKQQDPLFQKLEHAISTWLISRGSEDLVLDGVKKLLSLSKSCTIIDNVTYGKIAERLSHFINRDLTHDIPKTALKVVTSFNSSLVAELNETKTTHENQTLLVVNSSAEGFTFTLRMPNKIEEIEKTVPFGRPINATTLGRFRSFVTESLFLELSKGVV